MDAPRNGRGRATCGEPPYICQLVRATRVWVPTLWLCKRVGPFGASEGNKHAAISKVFSALPGTNVRVPPIFRGLVYLKIYTYMHCLYTPISLYVFFIWAMGPVICRVALAFSFPLNRYSFLVRLCRAPQLC